MWKMSQDKSIPRENDDTYLNAQKFELTPNGPPDVAEYFHKFAGTPVGSPFMYTMKDYPGPYAGQVPVKIHIWYDHNGNAPERFMVFELGPAPPAPPAPI
jgi:hypothetical protein